MLNDGAVSEFPVLRATEPGRVERVSGLSLAEFVRRYRTVR